MPRPKEMLLEKKKHYVMKNEKHFIISDEKSVTNTSVADSSPP